MNYYYDTFSKHRFIFRHRLVKTSYYSVDFLQWFSLIVTKVSQRVAHNQLIDAKTSLQKSVILSIIWGVSPTWRQPEKNFQNVRAYNFWVMWPVSKILRNLYLYTFSTSLSLKRFSRNPPFSWQFGAFLQHHVKLSETSKIKKIIISESGDQCQRYSGTFLYILLAFVRV